VTTANDSLSDLAAALPLRAIGRLLAKNAARLIVCLALFLAPMPRVASPSSLAGQPDSAPITYVVAGTSQPQASPSVVASALYVPAQQPQRLQLDLVAAAPAASTTSPSQILVLGMHHSGTSIVSNITMMMGAYGGEHDELLLHPENPLKFWERRDVVALDEQRLASGLQKEVKDRYNIPEWVAYGFDAAQSTAAKIHESAEAKTIVQKLNTKRPWVTKDPRMCLVADEWMQLLDAPVCVIMHREPLSVANSMMIYSHNVSLAEWASVYETYYNSAMKACAGKPTVVVQHSELMAAPYKAVKKLYDELVAVGVKGLTLPAEAKVSALVRPSTARDPFYLESERQIVGKMARTISDTLSKGVAAPVDSSKWLTAPLKKSEAIATLLTTNNPDYLRGALVLGSSIRSFESSRDMVALVTKAVPVEWHASLKVAGWTVLKVDEIDEFWLGKSTECNNYVADQGERWGHMATKLRLWQLTKYSRVMYLDADTVLTGPVSELFETVKTFAAEKPRYHKHFNAGVLLLSPSERTFKELLAMGAEKHGSLFGNVIDCTEQGLLNAYFNGAEGREVTKLDVGRADVKADWKSTSAPFAVHWITHVCPKPWLVADGAAEIEAHCDEDVYAYWKRVWDRLTAISKDKSSGLSFGSNAAARRQLRRLTGVAAGPSLAATRKPYESVGAMLTDVRDSVGRQLRQLTTSRRELRRRRYEYDAPWSEGTWAWIAIVGTLALGLAAGALLHKLFIKAPTAVGMGMTVVQATRMGFPALGAGMGPVGVVSAVDDDDDDDDDEEEEMPKGKK